MPDDGLSTPPAPAWGGFMKGADVAFTQARAEHTEVGAQRSLRAARERQQALQLDRDYHAQRVRDLARALAEEQANVRTLQAIVDELDVKDPEVALAQLEFIKTLPGVLGIRVERGYPIVMLRTRFVYEGRTYDLGDYEIHFTLSDAIEEEAFIRIALVRSGTKYYNDGLNNGYYRPLYYHGRINDRGECTDGWFCFGGRLTQIKDAYRKGEWGEMVHLIIACMNGVNPGEEGYILENHNRIADYDPAIDSEEIKYKRPTRRLRRRLRLEEV